MSKEAAGMVAVAYKGLRTTSDARPPLLIGARKGTTRVRQKPDGFSGNPLSGGRTSTGKQVPSVLDVVQSVLAIAHRSQRTDGGKNSFKRSEPSVGTLESLSRVRPAPRPATRP